MNISEQNSSDEVEIPPHKALIEKVKKLGGNHNQDICKALLQLIDVYKKSSGRQT
jgi:hypothetical protein